MGTAAVEIKKALGGNFMVMEVGIGYYGTRGWRSLRCRRVGATFFLSSFQVLFIVDATATACCCYLIATRPGSRSSIHRMLSRH